MPDTKEMEVIGQRDGEEATALGNFQNSPTGEVLAKQNIDAMRMALTNDRSKQRDAMENKLEAEAEAAGK